MNLDYKVKVTRNLYKAFDSYQRRERWIARELLKVMKEQYGLEKTDQIRKRQEGRG